MAAELLSVGRQFNRILHFYRLLPRFDSDGRPCIPDFWDRHGSACRQQSGSGVHLGQVHKQRKALTSGPRMAEPRLAVVLWNRNLLPTTFIDSCRLQTTVTRETFESYGSSAGKMYRFTVTSPGSTYAVRCANGGNSSTLLLEID